MSEQATQNTSVNQPPCRIRVGRGDLFALVDPEDYEWLSGRKWSPRRCSGGRVYACSSRMENLIAHEVAMHRLILAAPAGLIVDHINGDGLDNRRHNLRLCTHQENARNSPKGRRGVSSRYKGVHWSRQEECWLASIRIGPVRKRLGQFETQEDAAAAYDSAARELFGEFAWVNFPATASEEKCKTADAIRSEVKKGTSKLTPALEEVVLPSDGCRAIALAKGLVAIVDQEDYDWLSQWKWHICCPSGGHCYAVHRQMINRKLHYVYMHRLIVTPSSGQVVDHVNGNSLDNRRCNLRITDRCGNSANMSKPKSGVTSRYKGVHWRKDRNCWVAMIRSKNSKRRHLGHFATEEDAARAYDKAAFEAWGEFARVNFP